MSESNPAVNAQDAIAVAQRALARVNELEAAVDELRDEKDALEADVERLASLLGRRPENTPYGEQTRAERVLELQIALARKARKHGGKAAYHYTDVLALFDEQPSDGYAYKLMRCAAEFDPDTGDSETDGFEFGEFNGTKALRANWDAVSDEAVVHGVKNPAGDEGGE